MSIEDHIEIGSAVFKTYFEEIKNRLPGFKFTKTDQNEKSNEYLLESPNAILKPVVIGRSANSQLVLRMKVVGVTDSLTAQSALVLTDGFVDITLNQACTLIGIDVDDHKPDEFVYTIVKASDETNPLSLKELRFSYEDVGVADPIYSVTAKPTHESIIQSVTYYLKKSDVTY